MSDKGPLYQPSQALRDHPFWMNSSLSMYCETRPDGLGPVFVKDILNSVFPPGRLHRFEIESFLAVMREEMHRWMDENGIVP